MAENRLEFLNDEVVAEEPEVQEEGAQPEPEQPEEAGAQGEAPQEGAEPAASDKGEPAAPPAATEKGPDWTPVQALLDEREKRQAAARDVEKYQRELEQLRQKMAEQEQASQQKAPDFYDDPDARLRHETQTLEQRWQQQRWSDKLDISETMARQAYDNETVDAARDAFAEAAQSDPSLSQQLQRQAHPYDYVVKWHKQQNAIKEIGGDLDAYRQKLEGELAEKIRAEVMAEMQAQQSEPASQQPAPAQSRPKVPGSLSSAPAAKGPEPSPHAASGPLAGFFSS